MCKMSRVYGIVGDVQDVEGIYEIVGDVQDVKGIPDCG